MKNIEIEKMDDYEYGYALGFADGRAEKEHGQPVNKKLLDAIDPYAIGYKRACA